LLIMKILIVVHQFFPEFMGGTEVLTFDVAQTLKNNGNEVKIFTAFPYEGEINDLDRFDSYTYKNIDVIRFKHTVTPMGEQSNTFELEYNNLFVASYLREFFKAWHPDIVHVFHFHRVSMSIVDVCKEFNIPVLYTATDFWPICLLSQLRNHDGTMCSGPNKNAVNCVRHLALAFQPVEVQRKVQRIPNLLLGLIIKSIKVGMFGNYAFSPYIKALSQRPMFMKDRLNYIDKILVPTQLMGEILSKNGVDRKRIDFQRYGVNLNYYKKINKSRGSSRILKIGYIGALYEHKGVHLLIESVRILKNEDNIEIKIYGDLNQSPEYGKRLKNIAENDERIKFCGTFPNDEIGQILFDIDALVVPSIWYENTPLVVYSALAARCPVIASNVKGISEIIKHEENGLLFEIGDVKGLSEAIKLVNNDREFLAKLSDNIVEPKSMESYVTELERYYAELL